MNHSIRLVASIGLVLACSRFATAYIEEELNKYLAGHRETFSTNGRTGAKDVDITFSCPRGWFINDLNVVVKDGETRPVITVWAPMTMDGSVGVYVSDSDVRPFQAMEYFERLALSQVTPHRPVHDAHATAITEYFDRVKGKPLFSPEIVRATIHPFDEQHLIRSFEQWDDTRAQINRDYESLDRHAKAQADALNQKADELMDDHFNNRLTFEDYVKGNAVLNCLATNYEWKYHSRPSGMTDWKLVTVADGPGLITEHVMYNAEQSGYSNRRSLTLHSWNLRFLCGTKEVCFTLRGYTLSDDPTGSSQRVAASRRLFNAMVDSIVLSSDTDNQQESSVAGTRQAPSLITFRTRAHGIDLEFVCPSDWTRRFPPGYESLPQRKEDAMLILFTPRPWGWLSVDVIDEPLFKSRDDRLQSIRKQLNNYPGTLPSQTRLVDVGGDLGLMMEFEREKSVDQTRTIIWHTWKVCFFCERKLVIFSTVAYFAPEGGEVSQYVDDFGRLVSNIVDSIVCSAYDTDALSITTDTSGHTRTDGSKDRKDDATEVASDDWMSTVAYANRKAQPERRDTVAASGRSFWVAIISITVGAICIVALYAAPSLIASGKSVRALVLSTQRSTDATERVASETQRRTAEYSDLTADSTPINSEAIVG